MRLKTNFLKLIKTITILVIIVSLFSTTLLLLIPANVFASALPNDPSNTNWNNFVFTPDLVSNGDIDICQYNSNVYKSNPCNFQTQLQFLNAATNNPNIVIYSGMGQTNNSYIYSDVYGTSSNSGYSVNANIEVPNTSPNGAVQGKFIDLNNNSNSFSISISGYSTVFSTVSQTCSNNNSNCVPTSTRTGIIGINNPISSESNIINVTLHDFVSCSINKSTTASPISFYLENSGGQKVSTIQSSQGVYDSTMSQGSSSNAYLKFEGTFNNLSPGEQYIVSSSEYNAKNNISNQTINAKSGQSVDIYGSYSKNNSLCNAPLATSDKLSCMNTGGASESITWFLCPIFNSVSDFSSWALRNFIQPNLKESPLNTSVKSGSYMAWSQFRDIADLVLVIALIVVVFGESIGGGLIDAYTIRKILPRLIISIILINLSIYIVNMAIDITNILGGGISDLIISPFKHAGLFNFNMNFTQSSGVLGVGLIGALLSIASVGGFILAIFFSHGAFLSIAMELAFLILLPILLGIIAVFITLILRQAIILTLALFSPIAFALYVLPNTEQYFRKWWKLMVEWLMVYPIVMIAFAVADVLSAILLQTGNNGNSVDIKSLVNGNGIGGSPSSILATVMAFFLQFIPLFITPFAIRMAGGTVGKLHELVSNGGKTVGKLGAARKETTLKRFNAETLQSRQRAYAGLKADSSNQGRSFARRKLSGFLANRIGGYNLEQATSTQRAQTAKEIAEIKNNGPDGEIRGLMVNKKSALEKGKGVKWDRNNNQWIDDNGQKVEDYNLLNYDYRTDKNGVRQFQSLGGAWVDEADVDKAHSRWGRDSFAQQAALSYEMSKATNEKQVERIKTKYADLALGQGGWNLNAQQAQGSWNGAAFENQNTNLGYKHTDWQNQGKIKGQSFVDELYEKRGSYQVSQMTSSTIKDLIDTWNDPTVSKDTKDKIQAVTQTFMQDLQPTYANAGQPPILAPGNQASRQISSQGSAHVAERLAELATLTGVDQASPSGDYTEPEHYGSSHAPNKRNQKV